MIEPGLKYNHCNFTNQYIITKRNQEAACPVNISFFKVLSMLYKLTEFKICDKKTNSRKDSIISNACNMLCTIFLWMHGSYPSYIGWNMIIVTEISSKITQISLNTVNSDWIKWQAWKTPKISLKCFENEKIGHHTCCRSEKTFVTGQLVWDRWVSAPARHLYQLVIIF